jgi:nucleotide-binding universal stress UspA family protein
MGAGLHRLAELTGADLLVLGSSRKGRSGRVYLRDESSQALNGLPCALAVAPLDYARSRALIGELGVAYSGSLESAGAIATGRTLAARIGASISVFEALSLPIHDHVPNGWSTFTSAVGELEEQAVARIAERFGLAGSASCGEAIDELAVFSGSVDLLVAGSRNYGPPGRLVQGSTTQRLLRFARAPLLILARRQPAGSDAAANHAGMDLPVPASVTAA